MKIKTIENKNSVKFSNNLFSKALTGEDLMVNNDQDCDPNHKKTDNFQ